MSETKARAVDGGDRGGVGGGDRSLLTAALLFFAASGNAQQPDRARRACWPIPKILSDTVDALRDAQYEPILAANRAALETPFASSWRARPSPTSRWSNSSITPAPIARRATPHVDRLLQEDKGLRVVYRELPILGPDSVTAARLSLEASKLGRFAPVPRRAVGGRTAGARDDRRGGAGRRHCRRAARTTRRVEAELKRNFQLAGQLGATGTPLFVVGDRVMNGAVGYDALKAGDRRRRARGRTRPVPTGLRSDVAP